MKFKLVEKLKLNEMAIDRKTAIGRLEGLSTVLFNHLVLMYLDGGKTETFKHWLTEATNFCMQVNNVFLKPHNKRPDSKLFLDYLLPEVETANDMVFMMGTVPENTKEITNDLALDFYDKYFDIRVDLAKSLSDEIVFGRNYYINLFNKYFLQVR